MKIVIIGGAGYVGLITGVGFAELGHDVVAVDRDVERVKALSNGECHIYEPPLAEALVRSLESGRIRFESDLAGSVGTPDVVFVAVGSPEGVDGHTDLSQIESLIEPLASSLHLPSVVVVKSTVPVGVVSSMHAQFAKAVSGDELPVEVIVNPEFLSEGQGLFDFMNPTRIVIGGGSDSARALMRELYEPFTTDSPSQDGPTASGVPLIETSIPEAQMIKYAANAYLATRVTFINEVANICERVGANVETVVHGLGIDPRIGTDYFSPGIGFGGPCLEKDLKSLVGFSNRYGHASSMFQTILELNERQVDSIVEKTRTAVGGKLQGADIAVLGLAFKAQTNDVRSSLSLRIIEKLLDTGAVVRAHDPVAIPEARELLPSVEFFDDPYDTAEQAVVALVLTEWPEYGDLDLDKLGSKMSQRQIVDGRNVIDPARAIAANFTYVSVGRPTAHPNP